MDAEYALVLADEVASLTGASIRSLPALVSVAALVGATIGGVPVFRNSESQREAVFSACEKLRPLSSHNDVLAHVLVAYAER
ncbi:hypothetical protein [Corynebacterium epidermidicanis]|uniref:Uncharacterized protein n=1 Tax=Corynebacterium epidermidicanis TaxID=1050174 RepID=A0A0G3GMY7_9CORY|nr:hypothetical protein [Corynebacterium epidermidicanis]AKK01910.1 hypothetical protein CEPID_00060 [Corynebacterium epidermidicanis]